MLNDTAEGGMQNGKCKMERREGGWAARSEVEAGQGEGEGAGRRLQGKWTLWTLWTPCRIGAPQRKTELKRPCRAGRCKGKGPHWLRGRVQAGGAQPAACPASPGCRHKRYA